MQTNANKVRQRKPSSYWRIFKLLLVGGGVFASHKGVKTRQSNFIFWGILILLSVGAIVLAFQFDAPTREAILESQGEDWKKTTNHEVIRAISKYGDWPQIALAAGIGIAISVWMRSRRWTEILAAALIASTLTGLVANVSKLSSGRTRPRESPKIEQGFYGPWHDGKFTIGNSKYSSFPSGHTATAVGFATPFLFARSLFGIPVFIAALLVAWSRMALGAHHLSDVVTSTILAFFIGWYVLRWVRRDGERTWKLILAWLQKHVFKKQNPNTSTKNIPRL